MALGGMTSNETITVWTQNKSSYVQQNLKQFVQRDAANNLCKGMLPHYLEDRRRSFLLRHEKCSTEAPRDEAT